MVTKPPWWDDINIAESVVKYNCQKYNFPIPVIAMPMWEGTGNTVFDASGNKNHGVIIGGKWNSNLILDDNGHGILNDYVYRDIGKLATHNRESWSIFIISKMYATNDKSHLFNQKCDNGGAGGFYFIADRDGIGTMSLGYTVPGSSTWGVYDIFSYTINATHTWGIVHDSITIKTYVYKDGIGKQTTFGNGENQAYIFNDGFYMGRSTNYDNYNGWHGEISCVYAFDKVALTPDQVKFLNDNPYFMYETPTTGSIAFSSTPSGADIYLDSVLQTPKTPATITDVSAGSHSYTLKLSGYNDASGTVSVTAGETATVSLTLTPLVTTGSISFSSSPPGADIYLDTVLQTPKTPATITDVSAGSHSYTLKLSGYNDASGTVSVTAGETATVTATLTLTPLTCDNPTTHYTSGCVLLLNYDVDNDGIISTEEMKVALDDFMLNNLLTEAEIDFVGASYDTGSINAVCPGCAIITTGSIAFSSTPSNADIYLDSALQSAKTPSTITSVSAGSHSYTLKLTGYEDASGTVTVTAGETATVSVTLTPIVTTGSIAFSSTPSNADIYLDSALQSAKTPSTITSVSAGSHSYTLKLTGYEDASGTVTVTAGETATVSVTLTPIVTTGSIAFSSTPSNADIYLDSALQSAKTPSTITSVSAGSHSYTLKLTGYEDASGTVTVTAGSTATVSVTLTPIVTTGSIAFSTSPSGADIYLDGTLQSAKTPATITSVSAGSHSYTLKLTGYEDASGTVTVTAGSTATVSVTLTPIVTTGSIAFSTSPSGADIYLDGTLQSAKTPATITSVSAGSHSYTLKLAGYNDASGTVTVIAGSTSTVSVVLVPTPTYDGWIARMGGIGAIIGNLAVIGNIIDGYLGMIDLGFIVTLSNVGTTIDYYLGM